MSMASILRHNSYALQFLYIVATIMWEWTEEFIYPLSMDFV